MARSSSFWRHLRSEALEVDWNVDAAGTRQFWAMISEFLDAKFARGMPPLSGGQKEEFMKKLRGELWRAEERWAGLDRPERVMHIRAIGEEVEDQFPQFLLQERVQFEA